MTTVTKIIKNNSGSEVTILGTVIANGSSYTVQYQEERRWANDSRVTDLITAGTIVINDGTSDLNVAEGIEHIQKLLQSEQVDVDLSTVPNLTADDDVGSVIPNLIPDIQKDDVDVVTQSDKVNFKGNVAVTDEGSGKATIEVGTSTVLGTLYQLIFGETGSAGNEYLDSVADGKTSNDEPQVIPFRSKIIAYTFTNTDNDSDTDIEIYRVAENTGNSPIILLDTWLLRNARTARKTNFPSNLIFEAGDKVTVFVRDQGINPDNVVFTIYLQILDDTKTEVIETWSGSINPVSVNND